MFAVTVVTQMYIAVLTEVCGLCLTFTVSAALLSIYHVIHHGLDLSVCLQLFYLTIWNIGYLTTNRTT